MRSGTHGDSFFWSKSRCFASKNHRPGLGPIETRYSDTRHAGLYAGSHRWGLGPKDMCNCGHKVAVLHAQNDRWCLGPIETCYSGADHADLPAQNDRWGLVPIETRYSGPKVAVLHPKTTDEGWDLKRLVILVIITLYCMHKTTGDVWDS